MRTLPDDPLFPERRIAWVQQDPEVVDLASPAGTGPLWGTASDDLNATLLAWEAGGGTPEHVNDERDVLLVVLAGSGTVFVEGKAHAVAASQAILVEKGRTRRIESGPDGIRYLSVHLRRAGLQLARFG